MATKRALGYIPDIPDHRDLYMSVRRIQTPPKVDLRAGFPPVFNQGSLGSCTAQAVCALLQSTEFEQGVKGVTPSRLFVYYNTRVLHGTTDYDSGASIRNAIKAAAKQGYCREDLWPHMISEFKQKPSLAAYKNAAPRRLKDAMYMRVPQSLNALRSTIAGKNPVVFGFTVYEDSIEAAGKTGVMPMPKKGERADGGHAVLLVGYDDARRCFLVRNSWGTKWGLAGHYWMPYDYVLNEDLSADFWTVTGVTAKA